MVLFGPGSGGAIRSSLRDPAPVGTYRHIGAMVVRRSHMAVALHTELARQACAAPSPVAGGLMASIRVMLRLVFRAVGRKLAGLILPSEVVV